MKNIAIITARSGSKGLPDKNIRPLNKKPLLAYSIEAALQSHIFDCVHVSTDSNHYAQIARDYGADVPFLRSKELSTDTAGSWETVLEVLDRYESVGQHFNMVTLLQPTSPLRTAEDIQKAYNLYQQKQAGAVVSVCEVDHSPLLCNILPFDHSMDSFIPKANIPRQTMPQYYRLNGALYLVDCQFLRDNINIYRDGCFAYIMSRRNSVDIDTIDDFEYAEFLLNKHPENISR